MSYALDTVNLQVRFGDRIAVRDASLHVSFGEIVALLGPNGAGKTTLVETLLGFRSPHHGTVRVHGLDPVRHHREVVLRTGALLQRGGVWFPMTPRQVLTLTATYYPEPRQPSELIAQLRLEACAETPWRRLSGGEQQRTLLALALVGRPKVLVLDEPTAAVDPEGRHIVRELLAQERDRGCAILLTTHELIEAERSASRVVIMNHGLVVAAGTVDELAGEPTVIIETGTPVSASSIAEQLGVVVRQVSPTVVQCSMENTPSTMAALTGVIGAQGAVITAMRSRASLEERYLELIAEVIA